MSVHYNSGDVVLNNWKLVRLIGEGSFGRVFEAEREDFGTIYKAAIKIITVPQNQSEIRSVRADGMDDDSAKTYFRGLVEELVQEFALMSRLKGTANIVSYEDHTVIEHSEGIGWDIIIRMELLTPLLDYSIKRKFARQDVIKLGIDICKALELCQKFNIIHRDIKPDNIFVSDLGDYKLGDFGIARTVEKTMGGLSKKGTYNFMAPEVYRGYAYGSCVDIYSLGLVLYRLLNDNRAPFLPAYPAQIAYDDNEIARAKRFSGERLPSPKNVDGRLAEIVLKACAYDAKGRYSSPMQMREELEAILYSREETPIIYPKGDGTSIESVEYVDTDLSDDDQSIKTGNKSKIEASNAKDKTELLFHEEKVSNKTDPKNASKKFCSICGEIITGIGCECTAHVEDLGLDEPKGIIRLPAEKNANQRKPISIKLKRRIALIVAVTIVAFFIGSMIMSSGGNQRGVLDPANESIVIPNFVNRNYEDIVGNDEYQDLFNFRITYRTSDDFAEGLVIEHNPAADRERTQPLDGHLITVLLLVSSGDGFSTEMPDLRGMYWTAARQQLHSLDLELIVHEEDIESDETIGYVVETDPPFTALLQRGDTVVIRHSAGSQQVRVEVPNLVGSTEEQLQVAFEELGLILNVSRDYHATQPEGIVTHIARIGESVESGQRITVHVSAGPPPTPTSGFTLAEPWFDAYMEFVLNEEYLLTDEGYDPYCDWGEIAFVLYDIDSDGIPELIIRNGVTMFGTYDPGYHVYTYRDGRVVNIGFLGLGEGGGGLFYSPRTEFSGIFLYATGEGLNTIHYIELIDGEIPRVNFLVERDGLVVQIDETGWMDNYKTDDDALYEAWNIAINHRMSFNNLDEIRQMGWGEFVRRTFIVHTQ